MSKKIKTIEVGTILVEMYASKEHNIMYNTPVFFICTKRTKKQIEIVALQAEVHERINSDDAWLVPTDIKIGMPMKSEIHSYNRENDKAEGISCLADIWNEQPVRSEHWY